MTHKNCSDDSNLNNKITKIKQDEHKHRKNPNDNNKIKKSKSKKPHSQCNLKKLINFFVSMYVFIMGRVLATYLHIVSTPLEFIRKSAHALRHVEDSLQCNKKKNKCASHKACLDQIKLNNVINDVIQTNRNLHILDDKVELIETKLDNIGDNVESLVTDVKNIDNGYRDIQYIPVYKKSLYYPDMTDSFSQIEIMDGEQIIDFKSLPVFDDEGYVFDMSMWSDNMIIVSVRANCLVGSLCHYRWGIQYSDDNQKTWIDHPYEFASSDILVNDSTESKTLIAEKFLKIQIPMLTMDNKYFIRWAHYLSRLNNTDTMMREAGVKYDTQIDVVVSRKITTDVVNIITF
jgi:hypothetical protein